MSQQGLRQASVRAVSGTTLTYEGDWHDMWDGQGIAAGTFNERMLRYINQKLGTSYTEINGAMQALAVATGATNFGSMGTFDASIGPSTAAGALLGSETDGLAFSASDDTMEIRDTVTPANSYTGSYGAKFTTTRASTAYYYNSSQVITSAAVNVQRRDYDPALGVVPGYLHEEARTNARTYSNDFTNAVWTKSEVTLTANSTTAPDGTTTAHKLVPTTLAGQQHKLMDDSALGAVGTDFTVSMFVKPAGYTQVGFRENRTTGNSISFFLTGNGAVDVVRTAAGKIWALPNGWYRIEATFAPYGSTPSVAFYIYNGSYTTGDPFGYAWTADGTSGVYAWQCQVEGGASATSVIPTTSAAVTRAADAPSLATTAFNYQTANVTLYAKYALRTNTGTAQTLFSQDVRAFDLFCNLGTPNLFQTSLGACVALSTPAAGSINKVAAGGALNDFALSLNGAAVVTDATTSAMLAVTSLTPGSRAGANQLNGWLLEAMHLPRRMSNAELVTVTT